MSLNHGRTETPITSATSTRNYDLTSLAPPQTAATLTALAAFAVFLYWLFAYLDVLPITVSQALWQTLVFLTPTRIILALDPERDKGQDLDAQMEISGFQAKSEAIQRILGVRQFPFSSMISRSTSLQGLGSSLLLGGKDHVPPGLGNWDNSCYQNSVIQGLASLRSFREFVERNLQTLDGRGPLSSHLALKDILQRLNDPASHGQTLWIPGELKSMCSWQQQDAQEYFSKIMDQLDREIRQASKTWTSNAGLKMTGLREHAIGLSPLSGPGTQPVTKAEQYAPLRSPLDGLLAQRVGCMRCGWTDGLSLIPFNCLTVSLGRNWEYDIRECLDEYMTLEPIEGVECAKCTLLRTEEQLRNLLKQIESDEELRNQQESPNMPGELKAAAQERLDAVRTALEESDFTESTLSKKCHIPSKNRATVTKSRQAVIARPPQAFVIHVNRSVFDETTGMLRKNFADVRFPSTLDIGEWCLGTRSAGDGKDAQEEWTTDPQASMLPQPGATVLDRLYELRAVLTHYGRHENGHYICYRKYPVRDFPASVPEAVLEADGDKERTERWFRLSDEDVQMVSEKAVFSQGGVFMLFYERVDDTPKMPVAKEADGTALVAAVNGNAVLPETACGVFDGKPVVHLDSSSESSRLSGSNASSHSSDPPSRIETPDLDACDSRGKQDLKDLD